MAEITTKTFPSQSAEADCAADAWIYRRAFVLSGRPYKVVRLYILVEDDQRNIVVRIQPWETNAPSSR